MVWVCGFVGLGEEGASRVIWREKGRRSVVGRRRSGRRIENDVVVEV